MAKVKVSTRKADSGQKDSPTPPKKSSQIVIGYTNTMARGTGKFLLCGNSGVGKTLLAGQFPDPFIINLEMKIDVLASLKIPFTDVSQEEDCYLATLNILRALRDHRAPFDKLKPYPKTVVLDSLTRLSTKIEHNIVQGHDEYGKKTQDEALYISDYNIVGRRVYVILDSLVETGLTVVATAGIAPSQDKNSEVFLDPNMTGKKLGPQVAHFFTEVYYMDKMVGEKSPRFFLYTVHNSFRHARTSFKKMPQEIENPTYKDIVKHMV